MIYFIYYRYLIASTGCLTSIHPHLQIWCILLSFGLSDVATEHDLKFATLVVVGVSVISLLLLSVDEVSNQLEDPFKMMPIDEIMAAYERDINR